jgi:cell division protein FtsB
VLDQARAAITSVATFAGVSDVTALPDGTYQVTRADGSGFQVRLVSGPVADRAVATSVFGSDGVATVTVSDRATDPVVERALAHEIAELAALDQAPASDAARVEPLSAADLAELRVAIHQAETADRWSRGAARRELAALIDQLGLRSGMLGAEQRFDALSSDLQALVTAHNADPLVQPVVGRTERGDRSAADTQQDGRPTGLPRLRAYLLAHVPTTLATGGATALALHQIAGNPTAALVVGAGVVAAAAMTGPVKWLGKRVGLAVSDRRARFDARQDARTVAELDTATAAGLANRITPTTDAAQALDQGTAALDSQVASVQQQAGTQRQRRAGIGGRMPGGTVSASNQQESSARQTTAPQAGEAGPAGRPLTPHEQGRIAELRTLAARHDTSNAWSRRGAAREIRALLDSLGLRDGTPGADQRRTLLPDDVRAVADRFAGRSLAAAQEWARALVDRRAPDDTRPGAVAPWWMSLVDNVPNFATAATVSVMAGTVMQNLALGVGGIVGSLAAAAASAVNDPVMARREAAATDAREAWDAAHPATAADALLTQTLDALDGPLNTLADRANAAVDRLATVEGQVADLDRRLAESRQRRGGGANLHRLLFGNSTWDGVGINPTSTSSSPDGRVIPDQHTSPPEQHQGTPSADARTLDQLRALAAQHASARPWSRPGLARQVHALLDQLGLTSGTPGAEARRATLPPDLATVAERFGRPSLFNPRARIAARADQQVADTTTRPTNVPPFSAFLMEQSVGAGVQAGVTVGLAAVLQALSAATAGAIGAVAGGVVAPFRDGAMKRLEARAKDARKEWDSAHPATDSNARLDRLAAPAAQTIADATGRLGDASARLNTAAETIANVAAALAEARTRASGVGALVQQGLRRAGLGTGPTTNTATDPTAGTAPTSNTDPTATPDAAQRTGQGPLTRADVAELLTAAHQVGAADAWSGKPALRELWATIDRLGLRDGMLGAADLVAALPVDAQQVVAEYGGNRGTRPQQLANLLADRRNADDQRPTGLPPLRTYLLSSLATTLTTGAAGTVAAIVLGSPLAPVIPIVAAMAAPVLGVAKWHAKRIALATDDRRARFDARQDARSATDRADQLLDRLSGPVADLEQQVSQLEDGLATAEQATADLTRQLAETNRRRGLLGRFLAPATHPNLPSGPDPATQPDPGTTPDPQSRISAALDPDAPTRAEPAGRTATAAPDTGPGPGDPGRITAAPVPGSTFHGLGRPVADPAAVHAGARAAMSWVAAAAGVTSIVEINHNYFHVASPTGSDFRLRLTVGPLTDGTVAQTVRGADGNFTVIVSDRAADHTITRAVAHEIAELTALHEAALQPTNLDPGNVTGPINPAGLSAHDRGRLAEIRVLAAAYAGTDPAGRLAIRAELAALVDQLGLRPGTPDATSRWALLPADVAAHLIRLTAPAVTQDAVLAILGANPATLSTAQLAQQRDYRNQLVQDGMVPGGPQLTARIHQLATIGESAPASLPRLPAYAGQVIGLPAAHLARLQAADPNLAARVAKEGVYVDLTGRVDLTPYVAQGPAPIRLANSRHAYDLSTAAGRQAMLWEDRARTRATFRTAYASVPAAATLLSTHDFHYLADFNAMGLVSNQLVDAVRALVPPEGIVPVPGAGPVSVTADEIVVVADRPTLPTPEKGTTDGRRDHARPEVAYGRAVDLRTGQPAPVLHGTMRREQVQQGMLGSCGMLASIGSVAGHLPNVLQDLFHLNPDGTVDVLLHETTGPGGSIQPTGRRLRIRVTPDVPLIAPGQSAYADQSNIGAAWASLLEKALAAVDQTWGDARRDDWQQRWRGWFSHNDPLQAAPTGYARLNVGSTPDLQAEVLAQLTGEPARTGQFDTRPGQEAAMADLLRGLVQAGSPIITGTRSPKQYPEHMRKKGLPYGLITGHAYEVVGVQNGMVQLRNPWNSQHPAPMPVRAFLDLMAPGYAHLDRQAAPAPTVERPRGFGRVQIEESTYSFVYYALVQPTGEVTGLVAVEVRPEGQRVLRWTVEERAGTLGGDAVVAGPDGVPTPIGRAEAERIGAQVLGLTLPSEPELHQMLGG